VKTAIAYMLEQKPDLQAAAAHAGISTHELRQSLGKPHVRRYALAERQIALEAFCLGSPAAFAKARHLGQWKCRRQCRARRRAAEGRCHRGRGSAQKRQSGLQIVIVQRDGSSEIAYAPPPLLDVTPAPEAEPVPSFDNRDPGH
jgi:hypothetical protein